MAVIGNVSSADFQPEGDMTDMARPPDDEEREERAEEARRPIRRPGGRRPRRRSRRRARK